MAETYVFIDIETTGFSPVQDEIIEIAAVKAENGNIIDSFSSFTKPAVKIPFYIMNLTGINDEMLKDAPRLEDIQAQFLKFIGDYPIVGHNIAFDISFIKEKFGSSLANPMIDTLDLVQILYPSAPAYRLEAMKEVAGLPGGVSHRALEDAKTACNLFFSCFERLRLLSNESLFRICDLIKDRDNILYRILFNQSTKELASFSKKKPGVPYRFLKQGKVEESLFYSEPSFSQQKENKETGFTQLGIDDLNELMSPSGPFAAKINNYVQRNVQVEMLNTVYSGFEQSKHMLIEAGTGTGKSLAYLLPSVAWALSNNTRVVISTQTINLQEQLWKKDLPMIKAAANVHFESALVKGRNNYLCLHRWETLQTDTREIKPEQLNFVLKVTVWLTETLTGDKSELNISPTQHRCWSEISSEQESCLGIGCRWFHKGCFVSAARRQAEEAQVLIVNHSFLLTDLKLQNRLLPEYHHLIIDEAHHLEATATEQLGWNVSINGLNNFLSFLTRGFGTGLSPGLLNQFRQAVKTSDYLFSPQDIVKLEKLITEGFERVNSLYETLGELDVLIRKWMSENSDENNGDAQINLRIRDHHRHDVTWQAACAAKENLFSRIISLTKTLKKMAGLIENLEQEEQKKFLSLLKDIEYRVAFFEEINTNVNLFFEGQGDFVYWIERCTKPYADVIFKCAPVSVGSLLNDSLFKVKKSVLLTSATLSVDGSFDHFMDRVGLTLYPSDQIENRIFLSPFDYGQQALLCAVKGLPDPTTVSDREYIENVNPFIRDISVMLNGKTMVLFTSHSMLREAYKSLGPELSSKGIRLLGHGIDGGRTRLTEEFRKADKAVLFGASSFWEGVDLPGDILKCVIIVRLPFAPPGTPVVEARSEELIKKKKDPFYSYALPEAVIRLKQGFGRLIRSEKDDGVVIILDRRIVDRRYGRKFLNSLPLKTHFKGDSSTVLQKVSDWLQGERPEFEGLNIIVAGQDIKKFLKQKKPD